MVWVTHKCPKCGEKRNSSLYAYQSERWTEHLKCGAKYIVKKDSTLIYKSIIERAEPVLECSTL